MKDVSKGNFNVILDLINCAFKNVLVKLCICNTQWVPRRFMGNYGDIIINSALMLLQKA